MPMLALLAFFALVPEPVMDPIRYPVWKWGGTAPRSFAYYKARGFTGVGSPMISAPLDPASKTAKDVKLSLDEAAKIGLDYSIYLNPLMDPSLRSDPDVLAERYDGQKLAIPYPRQPKVIAHAERTAESVLALFKGAPAWKQSLLGSEFQLDYDFGKLATDFGRSEANADTRAGFVVNQPAENLPKDGLVADDNNRMRTQEWWFHRGMGDASLNRRMADILNAGKPDLLTWHDPFRLYPSRTAAEGLGAISTWTYAFPDMTRLLYTRVLQRAAKESGQKAIQTITLYLYPRFVEATQGAVGSTENDKPTGEDAYTAGPDFAREALWLVFSQRPDGIAFYHAGKLSPDDPAVDKGRASPETFDAIAEVVRVLVEPYGPSLLAGTPMPAQAAVLLSGTALTLGRSPKLVGYPNEQILPFCSLLAMNHVPFDVLFDQDVVSGKLDGYKLLVLPQAGALTRTMAEKIRSFTSRGGVVIADRSLAAEVPGAIRTDYDFTFQRQVDGTELAKGTAITGEENRRRMEGFAADLRSKLPKLDAVATADSPRAIVNVVNVGSCRFVFVVNDNRECGPRFGGKLMLDRGVPLRTKVDIAWDGPIYEATTGQRMPSSSFTADLPAAEGKLFVCLPSEPPTPTIESVSVKDGVCSVEARLGVGAAYPASLELLDAGGQTLARWGVTSKDGRLAVRFNMPPGTDRELRIRVTDLATRQSIVGGVASLRLGRRSQPRAGNRRR